MNNQMKKTMTANHTLRNAKVMLRLFHRQEWRLWIARGPAILLSTYPFSVLTQTKDRGQTRFNKQSGEISQGSSSMTVVQSQEMDHPRMRTINRWICKNMTSFLYPSHLWFVPKSRTTTFSEAFFNLYLSLSEFPNKYQLMWMKTSSWHLRIWLLISPFWKPYLVQHSTLDYRLSFITKQSS
jgi:hypothetical protein